jgi:RNA polymerase sigma-70 factor (ECF subfamily)
MDARQLASAADLMQPQPQPQAAAIATAADFDSFYRGSYGGVVSALAYTLNDVELAQEATDEAMARAFQRWDAIGGYDNPGGWVYRVGLNWARSRIRRLSRALPFRERNEVADPPIADPALRHALAELPTELRSVVVCRLLLDWSVGTTAEALELKPGTVKSRLHRALHALETTLAHMR